MSVIFKGVEMPAACCFVDKEQIEYCKFYNVCKERDTIKTNCKPSDCPVKALEQEPILDKIRAEIQDTGAYEQEVNGKTEFVKGITYCLSIIDKYKAESEE